MFKASIFNQSANINFANICFFLFAPNLIRVSVFKTRVQLNDDEGQFSASNDLIDTDDFLMPPSFENILRGLGVFPT